MSSLLLVNTAGIVTPAPGPARGRAMRELTIHHNAALYAEDGVIKAIGPRPQVEPLVAGDPLIVNGGGNAVIPGLIDSHTHLVFSGSRENEFDLKIAGATYQEIAAAGGGILSTVAATRAASREELIASASKRLAAALRHGTTTMEIKSGYGLDLENERKMLEVIAELGRCQPVELVPTFMAAHAIPAGTTLAEQTGRIIAMLDQVTGLAEYCDAFCEAGYFGLEETRAIFAAARSRGLGLRLHADQLSSGGGAELAVAMGARSADHLEQIDAAGIARLAASETCATLLPGVSLFLNYGYPPARALIDQGAIVALASNCNPGSCMCLNLQLIFSLACTQMRMTAAEALTALTANAAWALQRPHLGCLAPGLQADLLVLDAPDFRFIPYFMGQNHVRMVIKKGEVVVG